MTTLPDGFYVRKLNIDDLQLLKNFDKLATFEQNDTPADHEPPEYTDEEVRTGIEKQEVHGIFDKEDKMIAFYWLEIKPESVYIGGLAVHPDYRNQKIGQFCMEQADIEATNLGKPACTLTVDPYNSRGIHVYFKNGYQITGYTTDTYGIANFIRFHMEKALNKTAKGNYTEEVTISVNDSNADKIKQVLEDGYIGSRMEVSDKGRKENLIVYSK